MARGEIKTYQREFLDFLLKSGAASFGKFTTKSGRISPYFINTGRINSGSGLTTLGDFYAKHISAAGLLDSFDIIFGPAYKGIPLAVAAGSALFRAAGRDYGISFDRKEAKDHGDKGRIVGAEIKPGARVLLVEDVITAGTTLKEVVPMLRREFKAEVFHVVLAVDRSERGAGEMSAKAELESELDISIHPIIDIHQILELVSDESCGLRDKVDWRLVDDYRAKYVVL